MGVQEVTFCGFKDSEIKKLADCIGRLYNGDINGINEQVEELIQGMNEFTYLKR